MEAWILNLTVGELLIDFSLMGALLLAGTLLRRYVPFFQRYLIPNSLIAGFLGLLLGAELFNVLPFDAARMGAYVYHLLALTFICVGLFKTEKKHSWGVINLGFMQVVIMLLQGILGLSLALAVTWFLVPDFNPATGILLPLGFSMGPGIAYSIGQSWAAFGYENAGSIGLTFAAIGFLVAYFFGMTLVNRHVGREKAKALPRHVRQGIRSEGDHPIGSRLSFSSAAIEPMAVHVALVGAIYWVTWWITGGLAQLLTLGGLEAEIPVLWSFHFIIANAVSLGTRKLVLKDGRGAWIDDGTVHRLTGTFAEYLIAASIMGISLHIALRFALPIVAICVIGAYATYRVVKWAAWTVFSVYQFERFIGLFAQMTGTISSGLALLRVTDPEYRSPVAQELVLSSGVALCLGFPLLLVINMPFTVFDGKLMGFGIVLGLMFAYLLVLSGVWFLYVRRNRAQKK